MASVVTGLALGAARNSLESKALPEYYKYKIKAGDLLESTATKGERAFVSQIATNLFKVDGNKVLATTDHWTNLESLKNEVKDPTAHKIFQTTQTVIEESTQLAGSVVGSYVGAEVGLALGELLGPEAGPRAAAAAVVIGVEIGDVVGRVAGKEVAKVAEAVEVTAYRLAQKLTDTKFGKKLNSELDVVSDEIFKVFNLSVDLSSKMMKNAKVQSIASKEKKASKRFIRYTGKISHKVEHSVHQAANKAVNEVGGFFSSIFHH